MSFSILKKAVAAQFKLMEPHGLFRVDVTRDQLWDTYLNSFVPGTNPIYRERTEHDCQCCKSFIRTIGGLVTIIDGKLVSIWDIKPGNIYQVVVDAMSELAHSCPIDNIFLHTEKVVGTDKSFEAVVNGAASWEHFFLSLPATCVLKGELIGPKLSDTRSTKDVFLRGLKEITLEAIDTVIELIGQNSLYRGEEHLASVKAFRKLKVKFEELPGSPARRDQAADLFVWSERNGAGIPVVRIRSTVIGTLLTDLSDGMDMDAAVGSFEAKVAPTNYKRPTALVTKAMIKNAQEKIEELGFTSALTRRYATFEDITINNLLYANRSSRKAMNVFDDMAAAVPEKVKALDKVEEVTIDHFLANILPKADSLELLFENRHAGNLVSLIAPEDPGAKNMFKWPNNFSWSYAGELADSMKERVKKAGGSVTGDLCCRLAWDYTDDLDFHMAEPNGFEIDFRSRRRVSPNGGMLDVDANGADGMVPHPVENIFYANRRDMRTGTYELKVHNYSRRSTGVGFEVEVEFGGQIHHMVYEKVVPSGTTVVVAKIQFAAGEFKILSSLPSTQASKQIWNVPTQTFNKVNVIMLSPNYWDERAVGNKHFFFMLDGCLNEDKARGFFNEFLTDELNAHRKVIEMVGSKMKTDQSAQQLSGLGFSSTQRNNVLCRVKGSFARTIKINF